MRPLAALMVLPLASCVTYQARPIHPEHSARKLARRSLRDPRLLHFIVIEERHEGPPRWNLETLSLVATYERPDLSLATARFDEARAGERIAAQLPNPTLSFQPTYNTTTTVPSPWKVGPVVSFLIRAFGSRPALMARAGARVLKRRANP
jgi:cobalt-zinc-cadmium efflux system outer membrane protein